jgi:hypothetical protein
VANRVNDEDDGLKTCSFCKGSGECAKCNGTGERIILKTWPRRGYAVRCYACEGSGICGLCCGTGTVEE